VRVSISHPPIPLTDCPYKTDIYLFTIRCFLMGALADKAGRKPCGVVANVCVSVGGYASAFAPGVTSLMGCRFLVGLGVGAAFVPVDMLAEACPDDQRSRKTQIANLSFSIGVVLITVRVGAFPNPDTVYCPSLSTVGKYCPVCAIQVTNVTKH
jgi:MFS family permease